MDLNTLHQLAAYRPQQPMRLQPAAMPQTAPDPFAQAWAQHAMQPLPEAQMPQAQQPATPPVAATPAPNANDPTAPVQVTPQVGIPSGGGSMDKIMGLLKMFGIGG